MSLLTSKLHQTNLPSPSNPLKWVTNLLAEFLLLQDIDEFHDFHHLAASNG